MQLPWGWNCLAAHGRVPPHLGHHPSCGGRKVAWVQDSNPVWAAAGKSICPGRSTAQRPWQSHNSPHQPVQGKQERKRKRDSTRSTALRGGAEVTRDVSPKVTYYILQHLGFYQGSFLPEFLHWSDGTMAVICTAAQLTGAHTSVCTCICEHCNLYEEQSRSPCSWELLWEQHFMEEILVKGLGQG